MVLGPPVFAVPCIAQARRKPAQVVISADSGSNTPRARPGRAITARVRIVDSARNANPWCETPRYATRTAMVAARVESKKPHPSFDIDGDGIVSSADFKLASRCGPHRTARWRLAPLPGSLCLR